MALEDDLGRLEASIRQLQVEWDKFFGGVERRPPSQLQSKVEALVRQYAYAEMRNAGERFRYQTLTARYNTFNEMWNKRLRAMEEGRPLGAHGPRAQALAGPAPAPAAGTPGGAVAAAPAASASRAGGGARPGAPEFRVSDAGRDATALRELYEDFAASRRRTGEPAVKFESFRKLIAQQSERLKTEKGARAVDFRVETRDGKVSLKARPVK